MHIINCKYNLNQPTCCDNIPCSLSKLPQNVKVRDRGIKDVGIKEMHIFITDLKLSLDLAAVSVLYSQQHQSFPLTLDFTFVTSADELLTYFAISRRCDTSYFFIIGLMWRHRAYEVICQCKK